MTPSERINQDVQDRLAPLLQAMGGQAAMPQATVDSMRLDAILHFLDTASAIQSLSPSRVLERVVEQIDSMTTGSRATFLALLGERYKPNGERR